jgi:sugar diacid utilization regulator
MNRKQLNGKKADKKEQAKVKKTTQDTIPIEAIYKDGLFLEENHIFSKMYRFDDIALDYLLDRCRGELPKELVCARRILSLKQFDELHNTDYFHTLQVYVKNHLNAVQTAKLLFIHRSTFLYRMEKIKEILHIDLDDYDTLLYVMITFKIMESDHRE